MMSNKIAIMWPRFGPYHISRLEASGSFLMDQNSKLIAIETARTENVYQWDIINGASSFDRIQLFQDAEYGSLFAKAIIQKVVASLDSLQPDVIAINGYTIPESRAAIFWARKNRKAVVLTCDSNYFDAKRKWYREAVKKCIIRLCDAGLVGGSSAKDYMVRLGMQSDKIFLGYDAVDNEYFTSASNEVKSKESKLRKQHGLPDKYFLSSNRFIPKKNLFRLLDAYKSYLNKVKDGWKLVLLGDGELMPKIRLHIENLGLRSMVVLPGFKQYKDLPVYYSLAKCYIQASTLEQWGLVVNEAMASGLPVLISNKVGCAIDLVKEGENGWTFDPFSAEKMSKCLLRMHKLSQEQRCIMGKRSEDIISEWGLDRFSKNLFLAAQAGLEHAKQRNNGLLFFDKLLLRFL